MIARCIGAAVDKAIHFHNLLFSVWWLLRPTGIEEHTGNTGVIPGRPRRCNQISIISYLAWTSFTTIVITIPDREKVLSKHV